VSDRNTEARGAGSRPLPFGRPADRTGKRDLVVLDGTTFFRSDLDGDVDAGHAGGYFHDDVRHLSRWQLRADGEKMLAITAAPVDYYSARVVLAPTAENAPFSIRRDRFVTEGVHEDVVVSNLEDEELRLRLELRFDADFADVLEAQRPGERRDGRTTVELGERSVTFRYERDGFRRGTRIELGADARLSERLAAFDLVLAPHAEWRVCVDVVALGDGSEARPLLRCGSFRAPEPEMPLTLAAWLEQAPTLETDDEDLRRTYLQSLHDLASLRIRPRPDLEHAMPAAGIPWFMCVFGRDSILAAYEALPFQPTLAEATLRALAGLQARELDDWRDSEPGKMPHELRRGKLARLGEGPRDPYYGTHDATQLWLILLDEYERWTGDVGLLRELEPNARRALEWIDRFGDRDGDGYLEYERRSPEGLRNQCWKDSDDAIAFADGRRAEPPIAVCEIQGYTYDARLRAARLAREVWHDEGLADRQEQEAQALKLRFNRDYWDEDRGCFLLALAGRGGTQRVDSVTSNAGQLLWSGIVEDGLAGRLVERLLRPDMFSGWGIRTMSGCEKAYNPLRYHNGTVWPHDTALIAAGMARYGYREEALRVVSALLDAAAAFGHQLPEAFSGFPRDATDLPIRYPAALVPQAWAAAAALLALRTLLGLDARFGDLRAEPLDDRYRAAAAATLDQVAAARTSVVASGGG
jgi:glycogen debranching enzyme